MVQVPQNPTQWQLHTTSLALVVFRMIHSSCHCMGLACGGREQCDRGHDNKQGASNRGYIFFVYHSPIIAAASVDDEGQ